MASLYSPSARGKLPSPSAGDYINDSAFTATEPGKLQASRGFLWARLYTRKDMRALLAGLEEAFGFFGGVPQDLLFD